MSPEDQVAVVYSGTGGFLDRLKVERVREFHHSMLGRLHAEEDDLMRELADGQWDDGIEDRLGRAIREAVDDFGPDFDEEGEPIEQGESDRIRSDSGRTTAAAADGDGDGVGNGSAPERSGGGARVAA